MIGITFGQLTVSEMAFSRYSGDNHIRYWNCICSCGRSRNVAEPELKRLRVSHCDRRRKITRGPEYNSYSAMKARCYQRSHKDFHNYGGRGIKVCARWLNGAGCSTGFECFLMDMGAHPGPSHSIERGDGNGNYESGNCRWATAGEQVSNRRNTRRVVIDGQTITLADAARSKGLAYPVVLNRIDRYGMTAEEALNRPLNFRHTIVRAERER